MIVDKLDTSRDDNPNIANKRIISIIRTRRIQGILSFLFNLRITGIKEKVIKTATTTGKITEERSLHKVPSAIIARKNNM